MDNIMWNLFWIYHHFIVKTSNVKVKAFRQGQDARADGKSNRQKKNQIRQIATAVVPQWLISSSIIYKTKVKRWWNFPDTLLGLVEIKPIVFQHRNHWLNGKWIRSELCVHTRVVCRCTMIDKVDSVVYMFNYYHTKV